MNSKMSFPEIMGSLDLYQEAREHRTPPEWYVRLNRPPLAVEVAAGKEFEKAVDKAIDEPSVEDLPACIEQADLARRKFWQAHYGRRLDVVVCNFEMKLASTPASRYAGFHTGVAKALNAAEVAIGTAKIWQGEDAEDEFKGWRPLVIEAEDRIREAWDVFKAAEKKPLEVSRVFSPALAELLKALRLPTVQSLLELDESQLRRQPRMGSLEIAEILAKIGSPRPVRDLYFRLVELQEQQQGRSLRGGRGKFHRGSTIADAVGQTQVAAINGAAAKSGPLANLEAAYADLVKEGGRLYEVAVFFYDPLRRADQRARNIASRLREVEAKGQKPSASDLQEAVVAVQALKKVWAETVVNPPSAVWLVRAQIEGHFASLPKASRPDYEAILAIDETWLREAFVVYFAGDLDETHLMAKIEVAKAQIAFAKKAVEIGLSLFEAAELSEEGLEAKGLTPAEIALVDQRLEVIKAKKAEREALAAAKAKAAVVSDATAALQPALSPEAEVTAATDATTLDGAGDSHDGPAPAVEEDSILKIADNDPTLTAYLRRQADAARLDLKAYAATLATDAAREQFLAGLAAFREELAAAHVTDNGNSGNGKPRRKKKEIAAAGHAVSVARTDNPTHNRRNLLDRLRERETVETAAVTVEE